MNRKLTHEDIISRQVLFSRQPRVRLTVVLDNIRSLFNVGAIFRSADGVGVEKMFLCGITGYPPQGGIAKTALGSQESVPWEYQKDAVKTVKALKDKGYEVIALEQTVNAIAYDEYASKCPVCLVVGNEESGVSDELMLLCDKSIEIKMMGIKSSLNVAVAFGVAAFSIRQRIRM